MESKTKKYLLPECNAVEVKAYGAILQVSPIVGVDGLEQGNIVRGENNGFSSWD